MLRVVPLLVSIVALAIALPARAGEAPAAAPITVSAAISLTDVLHEVAAAWRSGGGAEVRFNLAGSNVLARQIVLGAPADVFVSADAAQMDVVEQAGHVAPGTRVDLLTNRLAIVTRASAPAVSGAEGLLDPAIRRIAIGNPSAVPAGVYARKYLEAAGLWDRLQGRIVPLGNVRAALAAVDSGGADAALVYATDVSAASRARLATVISDPRAPAIVYPAAVLTQSSDPQAAAAFLSWLRGREAAAIFRKYGFEPAGSVP
jgi:molybdate transport system substrate-binding protein